MKAELNNDHPLTEEELRPLFDNIQGNILRDHGRDYSIQLFLRFVKDPIKVRKWIQDFSQNVTSAQDQREQADTYKHFRKLGKLIEYKRSKEKALVNFFLSAEGYRKLGFKGSQIPQDLRFFNGMKGSRTILGDSYRHWESKYDELDAMILIAHDNWDGPSDEKNPNLRRLASDLEKKLGDITSFCFMEKGEVMYDRSRTGGDTAVPRPLEHFGYIDGISNPLFLESDFRNPNNVPNGQDTLQTDRYDPFAPLSLVLTPDPNIDGCYGSYLVFRKLEQDLKAFNDNMKTLCDKLGSRSRDFAEALICGRFREGTPLTLSESGYGSPHDPKNPNNNYNNFHYGLNGAPPLDADTGMRCPFHAHVRKANPRRYEERRLDPLDRTREKEREHRIVRRGITYGCELRERHPKGSPLEEVPTFRDEPEGVGLLFMCFQSDIGKQFEYIQRQLNYTNAGLGLDPVAGQQSEEEKRRDRVKPQTWSARWSARWSEKWESSNGTTMFEYRFKEVVKLRGGEYFFAPSIDFLKRIETLLEDPRRSRKQKAAAVKR